MVQKSFLTLLLKDIQTYQGQGLFSQDMERELKEN
jgi:hypothetical protein